MKKIETYKACLSEELTLKQKMKGTYDSPCLSICDYDAETSECQTCFMLKEEKTCWKIPADVSQKAAIWDNATKRKARR
jgi:predicted Fe-S protein YdhL (DUF1289 family)